jgi:hypothetical protein
MDHVRPRRRRRRPGGRGRLQEVAGRALRRWPTGFPPSRKARGEPPSRTVDQQPGGSTVAEVVTVGTEQFKRRNPAAVWLGLPLITLGIYSLVWWYKINDEARRYLRDPTIKPVVVAHRRADRLDRHRATVRLHLQDRAADSAHGSRGRAAGSGGACVGAARLIHPLTPHPLSPIPPQPDLGRLPSACGAGSLRDTAATDGTSTAARCRADFLNTLAGLRRPGRGRPRDEARALSAAAVGDGLRGPTPGAHARGAAAQPANAAGTRSSTGRRPLGHRAGDQQPAPSR